MAYMVVNILKSDHKDRPDSMNASKWERKIRPSALDDCPQNPGKAEKSLESIVYLVEKDEAAPTIEGHRFDFLLKDF